MKFLKSIFVFALCLSFAGLFAQSSEKWVITALEDAERMAILNSDTNALKRLMSEKIVVQNPDNMIVGFTQIMSRIKEGKISYSIFERRIDSIAFVNDIAIVMGLETLMPRKGSANEGKNIQRRFTNIWTKESSTWKLTARQATIVSIN